jgi:hypothetical protein
MDAAVVPPHPAISRPLVRGDRRPLQASLFDDRLQLRTAGRADDIQPDLTRLPPDDPGDRRSVVGEGPAVQPDPGMLLEVVSQLQEVLAIASQFAGHRRRECRLGDAVEDQQQRPRPAMGSLEEGPGPGVEDPAASRTRIVQHRSAVAAVDSQALLFAA